MKKCTIPNPQQFRNQATGIGQTRAASERTGAMRSACVSATIPFGQRQHADGYPPSTDAMVACMMTTPVRRSTLLRR